MSESKDNLNVGPRNIDSFNEETLVELQEEESEEGDVIIDENALPNYEIPGVYRVILNEVSQTALGVLVGIDVTGEYPWKTVKKELFLDNIEVHGEDSVFYPMKNKIISYSEEDVLIGYILDETNDDDEFYVCLTLEAKAHCEVVSESFMEKQYSKLEKSVFKDCRPWVSLGSEEEVDESIRKNSRPLIRVEIVSKFPVVNQPERFLARNTEAARDGYIELLPQRAKYYNVIKKRVDASIQANPGMKTSSAQTVPRYPQNIWTQCALEDEDAAKKQAAASAAEGAETEPTGDEDKPKVEVVSKRSEKEKEMALQRLASFLNDKTPSVERILEFNGKVDIYNLDYPRLSSEGGVNRMKNIDFKEFVLFSDFKAKNKFIAVAAWHQLHKNLVAIAYADSVPCVIKYPNESLDAVQRAVYGENPVLIWSISDTLKPKLYLESSREVISLSFCPYNENILIGGCVNGQIIIWDLSGRLEDNEEVEILTSYQENNRIALNSQMEWMKKIHDKSIVRTTAASNLKFSHSTSVTNISWFSSHFEVTSKGKLTLLHLNEERSMQFITISDDGTVLIWNIKISASDDVPEKLEKESARVPVRPSNLTLESSPLRVLDGTLKPIYKITARNPETTKLDSMLCLSFHYPTVNTIKTNLDGVPRMYESPIAYTVDEEALPVICVTSTYGEYLKISWSGEESTAGGISSENAKYISRANIHDGPINCCIRNPFNGDIVATVGGKILALWAGESQSKPFMWKQMKYYLTNATWSNNIPSQIYVITYKGTVDIWDFLERSDLPVHSQVVSGSFLTGICNHKLQHSQNLVSIDNSKAFFRLFHLPKPLTKCGFKDAELTDQFFKREMDVKKNYEDWNDEWEKKHADVLNKKKLADEEKFLDRDRKTKLAIKLEEERRKQAAAAAEKLRNQPITAEMKWKKILWECVEISIQIRKALNTAVLLMQEKPLRDIEAQKLSKVRKMTEGMNNRNKVFHESVAILFPEVITLPPEPIVPKTDEEISGVRKAMIEEYEKISTASKSTLKSTSYHYKYVLKDVAHDGKERRRYLDNTASIYAKRKAKIVLRLKGQRGLK